jgi:hypothetical protein
MAYKTHPPTFSAIRNIPDQGLNRTGFPGLLP